MTLNPFFCLFFLYLIANTYKFLSIIFYGGFEFLGEHYPVSFDVAAFSYLIQILSLASISLPYFFFKKANFERSLSNYWGFFLIGITVLFFIFNQKTGAGKAGSDFTFDEISYSNYFFVLLQPDVWFFLIAPFLKSNKIFIMALTLFTLSLLSRGWMGSILIMIVVWLIRYYPVRINSKSFWNWFSLFILIIITLPLLDAFKWGYRSGMPTMEIVESILSENYFSLFGTVIESVVARFSNLHMVIISFNNSSYFIEKIFNGEINWFYQNGILNSAYCHFYNCGKNINIYFAEYLTGESNLSWNLDTGISGWLVILGFFSPFVILYAILMVFGSTFLFSAKMGLRGCLLISSFSLIYFFHGWFNAYFNLGFYMIFFVVFEKINLLKNHFKF